MKIILIFIFIIKFTKIVSMELAPTENYLFSQEGNIPLLITVPHGGGKEIPGFPIRASGCLKKDIRTLELVTEMNEYFKMSGQIPYIVAALFSRKFIDANRSKERALENVQLIPVYEEYHNRIKKFIEQLKGNFPYGALLIDIHGQGREPSAIHRGTKNGTTVKNFILRNGPNGISGQTSIFGQLSKRGYSIFPPENELNDIPESNHFDGGFTVREYGKDIIDAIQIEIGTNWREKSECRQIFVKDFAEILPSFVKHYYKNLSQN